MQLERRIWKDRDSNLQPCERLSAESTVSWLRGSPRVWFCQVFGCSTDLTCSHRLRGLPSSAGSPSRLHLRALAPQRQVASFWQGTVEPQPSPHACSVVAWPIARQGFYGGQPTRHPDSRLSPGRSHSPHSSVTGSYDDRLMS